MGWENRDYYRDPPGRVFGAGFGARGWSITTWLIVLNVSIFVLDAIVTRVAGAQPLQDVGPLTYWGWFSSAAVTRGQVWRFFSFQFLHAGILHILFNMIILFFFGRIVERYLGSLRYLAFYLLGGIAGSLAFLTLLGLGLVVHLPALQFLFPHHQSTLLGASAGVLAVLVGAAVIAPDDRVYLFPLPISLSLRVLAWVTVGITAFMLFVVGDNTGGEAAHLGGAAAGYLMIRKAHWLSFAEHIPSLGLGGLGRKWRLRQQQRQDEQDARQQEEVDRILDKVKQHGLQSLSAGEKRTLQRATQQQRKR